VSVCEPGPVPTTIFTGRVGQAGAWAKDECGNREAATAPKSMWRRLEEVLWEFICLTFV
jgi:hypothetical protein